ncbi:MAG: hypothetical protein LBC18_02125 [Opitutaceae bacterium]|jgi:hypothetical protein|nr:hypothetical protein [Opitutaceae bacterium]
MPDQHTTPAPAAAAATTTAAAAAPAAPAGLPDAPAWAVSTASRLRYLQANFADDSRENRESFLEDELKKLLEPVPAGKRQLYLDTLAEKFPTWESLADAPPAPADTPAAGMSPDDVWALFLKTLPRYSLEQRELIQRRLADAGFVRVAGDSPDPDSLAEIAQKLKLSPADKIDAARLAKLFAALAEVCIMTEQLAWNVWKNLAPKSTIRRDGSAGDLRTALRRSVTGDPEVSSVQISRQLEKMRQLIAGLLASLGPAGKNFARRFQTRYSPEAIRDIVKLEGGSSIFGNTDSKLWKKYTELAGELSEGSIQTDMMDAVAQYAEDLMKGGQR